MEDSDIIALISAIIAFISLLIAIRSTAISRRALSLSEKSYNDKLPNFDLYYHKGYRITKNIEDRKRKFIIFHLTVSNKAELKNSFNAKLILEYLREDDSLSRAIIDHNSDLESLIEKDTFSFFENDIEIDSKSSKTKWLIFEQPEYLNDLYRIEKYEVRLMDLSENFKSIEAVLIFDI